MCVIYILFSRLIPDCLPYPGYPVYTVVFMLLFDDIYSDICGNWTYQFHVCLEIQLGHNTVDTVTVWAT